MSHIHTISSNTSGHSPEYKTLDGVEHLVVPATIIVEGVLNGALLRREEFGKFTSSWDGRPVPVRHPEINGSYVSANLPEVADKNNIGFIYNTKVEGDKLKTEIWINKDKAEKIGHGDLVSMLEAGGKMEVSTGYFADHVKQSGISKGKQYNVIHTNLRPDHLAVLPDEIGACSIADGCGTFNKKINVMSKLNDALKTLSDALGVTTNCKCEGDDTMAKLQQRVEALTKNSALTDDQKALVSNADEKTIEIFEALIKTHEDKKEEMEDGKTEENMDDDKKEKMEDEEKPDANTSLTVEQVQKMIANAKKEERANTLAAEIIANGYSVFSQEELSVMSVSHLEKLAQSTRPRDYSGAGGYFANSNQNEYKNYRPLSLNSLTATFKPQKKEGK